MVASAGMRSSRKRNATPSPRHPRLARTSAPTSRPARGRRKHRETGGTRNEVGDHDCGRDDSRRDGRPRERPGAQRYSENRGRECGGEHEVTHPLRVVSEHERRHEQGHRHAADRREGGDRTLPARDLLRRALRRRRAGSRGEPVPGVHRRLDEAFRKPPGRSRTSSPIPLAACAAACAATCAQVTSIGAARKATAPARTAMPAATRLRRQTAIATTSAAVSAPRPQSGDASNAVLSTSDSSRRSATDLHLRSPRGSARDPRSLRWRRPPRRG